jgi:hypothetical protein
MPYLHWETDRRRLKSAEILKRHGLAKWSPFSDIVDNALDPAVETNMDRVDSDGLLESITTTSRTGRISSKPVKITHQSKSQKKNLLGILLLKAAALFEAMDGFADEKLIEKHLSRRPPLHPRRTLDQSYYWTLKDTCSRDRDQVVYRGTAPSPKLLLLHSGCTKDNPKKDKACPQCTENVKKVPRVVMVDQLWMWILDESKSCALHSQLLGFIAWADGLQIQSSPVSRRGGEGTNQIHQQCKNVSEHAFEPLESTKFVAYTTLESLF